MSWETWHRVELPNRQVWRFNEQDFLIYTLQYPLHEWLHDHVGLKAKFLSTGPTGDWHCSYPVTAEITTFYFRDPAIAVLFKLTWV
jgi:hypothetical protein